MHQAGRVMKPWHWVFRAQFAVLLLIYFYLGSTRISAEVAATFNDLVAHALGYGIAAISAYIAFAWRRFFVFSLLFLWVFSIFVEVVQFYLPYRSFSLMDILANTCGLFVGALCILIWRRLVGVFVGRFFRTANL